MPWKLAMKRSRILSQEEIEPEGRFRSHGEPVRHDLFVAVGHLDAQLVELQELRRVGGAVVARRQIRLELARPDDATQLRGEGAATGRGHRALSWRRSFILVSPRCHGKWRVAPLCQAILTWRCWERWSVFLRSGYFLAASFFPRGCPARRVVPRGRASWRQSAVLVQRWRRCSVSYVARSWRRARHREGWRGGAPSGADELGDAVQPVLVEVVDRAVAQELACHEQRGLRVYGSAASVRRRAGWGQRWSGGAAIPLHGGVQRGCLLLISRRTDGGVGGG